MMKTRYRKIICVLLVISIFILFNNSNVYAKKKDACSASNLKTRYKPKIKKKKNDLNIKISKNLDESNRKSFFKANKLWISKVVITDEAGNKYENKFASHQYYSNNNGVIAISNYKNSFLQGYSGDVKIVFTISKDDKGCEGETFDARIDGLGRTSDFEVDDDDLVDDGNYSSGVSDPCSESGDFYKAFCETKKKAQRNGKAYDNLTESKKQNETCSNTIYTEGYVEKNPYTNFSYYYGKRKLTVNVDQYKYHYSPNGTPKTKSISCNKTCEEAVEVKYGPPVSSKAGLCFQYKVKVISRVVCHSNGSVPKPERSSICIPYPICHSSSWTGNQGGPNDNFDDCVKSCDGGKYSKECSKKCYNAVYGNDNKTSSVSNNMTASQMAKVLKPEYVEHNDNVPDSVKKCAKNNTDYKKANKNEYVYGCYWKKSDGDVDWYGLKIGSEYKRVDGKKFTVPNIKYVGNGKEQSARDYAPGVWYKHKTWGCTPEYHSYGNRGFYKAPDCEEECDWEWGDCSETQYLNRYNYETDWEANKSIYNTAKSACKATTSCTSEATFVVKTGDNTESDSLDKNNTSTYKIKVGNYTFPYKDPSSITVNKDGLVNRTVGIGDVLNNDDGDNEIKKGCYQSNTTHKDRYIASIKLPPTWFNYKTSEISYDPNNKDPNGWYRSDSFCSPLNTQDVNVSWHNYYTDNYVDGKTGAPRPNNYNILAQIIGFGFFKWNIDIKCWYSIKNPTPPPNTPPPDDDGSGGTCTKDCSPYDSNYRIRSVDLVDIFPSKDGAVHDASTVGNTKLPFNWSSKSQVTKNGDYKVKPNPLVIKIQKEAEGAKSKGVSYYSDDKLDYEFYLTPQNISELKTSFKEQKGNNYYNYKGEFISPNSANAKKVARYKSKVIRSVPDKRIVPTSDSTLFCNNMINHQASGCDNN